MEKAAGLRPSKKKDVLLILSAKYGLIDATKRIGYYNKKMSYECASEMQEDVFEKIQNFSSGREYEEIFINAGESYAKALEGIEDIFPNAKIMFAEGRIGKKSAHMKRWLREANH